MVHRADNTNNSDRLKQVMKGRSDDSLPVILPIHPRTEKKLKEFDMRDDFTDEIKIVEPVGHLDFVRLLDSAKKVATDSGGIQKEAFFLDTPCVTLRDETEWVETVEGGWNELVGVDAKKISEALNRGWVLSSEKPDPYGDVNAAKKIVEVLESEF